MADIEEIKSYLKVRNITEVDKSNEYQLSFIVDEMLNTGAGKEKNILDPIPDEEITHGYLNALVEQNWTLIRQQNEMLNELKKLNKSE